MCMNMYQLMFNTTRIPSAKTDHWATYHDDPEARRKVLVAHKNRFFIVDVYDQSNQLLSVPELEMYDTHHTRTHATAHTLHNRTRVHVVHAGSWRRSSPWGAPRRSGPWACSPATTASSGPRRATSCFAVRVTAAALARCSRSRSRPGSHLDLFLSADRQNRASLQQIEKTLFGVCLDEGAKSGLEVRDALVALVLDNLVFTVATALSFLDPSLSATSGTPMARTGSSTSRSSSSSWRTAWPGSTASTPASTARLPGA